MWRNLRETEQNEAKPCSKRKLQWGGAKCVNAALPNLQPQGNASIAKQNLTMCVSVWKVVDMHCAFRQQESCPLPWTLNTCLHITISLQYVGNMHCHIKTLDGSSATLGAFSSILSPGACAQHCKFNICIFWFQAALHVFCCIKFLTLFESHVKHWLAALKLWRFRSYIEGSKFISMCGSYRMPEINFNSMLKRYFLYGALVYAPVSFYSFPNE